MRARVRDPEGRARWLVPTSAVLAAALVGLAALTSGADATEVPAPDAVVVEAPAVDTSVAAAPVEPVEPVEPGREWVGAWGTALARGEDRSCAPCTVRSTAHLSAGGTAVRVTLSNVFGDAPLVVGRTTVSTPAGSGAAGALPGSVHVVTFDGGASVSVPAGEVVRSDAVVVDVVSGADLQVSTYLPERGARVDLHQRAHHTTFWAPDVDATSATDAARFTGSDGSGYVVSAVEVDGSGAAGTFVAFGDSITDGSGSTFGGDDRWTDRLAARFGELPASSRLGVVNAGIGGNRLLVDQGDRGESGPTRFARDVLVHDPDSVLVLLGINDVRVAADVSPDEAGDAAYAQQIIDALADVAAQARAQDVRVVGGTLLPFKGFHQYGPRTESVRQTVNAWIRTTDAYDAVVDLDAAVRDPADPARLRPAYDAGDGLHPGPAGYQAMADAIDVAALVADLPGATPAPSP
ncbi:SGNH/GDSL hydrolase family protein [Cellulosimicrobium terreum]|nr:SGNH/GDSL hydrolase family protein [Cellulosimicrobium terreum]